MMDKKLKTRPEIIAECFSKVFKDKIIYMVSQLGEDKMKPIPELQNY